jgi:hypothetical protein
MKESTVFPSQSLLNVFFAKKLLYFFLIFVNYFFVSCSDPNRTSTSEEKIEKIVSPGERVWMENFFQEFFLEAPSIYTVFGSKPISGKLMNDSSFQESMKKAHLYMNEHGIKGKEKEEILLSLENSYQQDRTKEYWEKWISFIEKFPNSPYLFSKHPTRCENIWSIHILNIQQTVWVLQKYYDLFRKELGFDFDPISVTLDFKNEDSNFWKRVFSNHLLTGIVYGYGYKNSYFFNIYIQKHENFENNPLFSGPLPEVVDFNSENPIKSLSLPRFRSFQTPYNKDPIIEKYEDERKIIQNKINKRNFFEKTLLQIINNHSE